jgi:hypothetical protein
MEGNNIISSTPLGYIVNSEGNEHSGILHYYFHFKHEDKVTKVFKRKLAKHNNICICCKEPWVDPDRCLSRKQLCANISFDTFINRNNILVQHNTVWYGPKQQTMEINNEINLDIKENCNCHLICYCCIPICYCGDCVCCFDDKKLPILRMKLMAPLTHKNVNMEKEKKIELAPPVYS